MRALAITLLLAASVVSTACTAEQPDDTASSAAANTTAQPVTIRFESDWSVKQEGPLVAGGKLAIVYAPARAAQCHGDANGRPAWATTGFFRINGGDVKSFEAAGLGPSSGTASRTIDLTAAGELEIWFQTTNRWGCNVWDSSFGNNYRFAIAPAADAPGWMGNAVTVVSRATCSAGPCDGDRRAAEQGFSYDTWARQRAAIRGLYFDVWKQGVTDFDNPELWKQLDARVHYRFGGAGAWSWKYVDYDRRVANDARYAFALRTIDPLPGATVTRKEDCPKFSTTISADGNYLETSMEYFFSVNGVELRPAPGASYRGRFSDYRGLYAICETR
jgi:hypothetical protein